MIKTGKIRAIIDVLSKQYEISTWWRGRSAFEMLIVTILSQRTYWKNVRAAINKFKKKFKSVKDVANADIKEIEDAIKPAGLYRLRARRIKDLAIAIMNRYDGDLGKILNLPYEEARKELLSIKGIGPKTADVFLMFIREEPVLPVDVHIFRVMRRLGIAREKDDYETLKTKLEKEISPSERMKVHLILIEFGRNICKAQNPKCEECPIKKYCEYYRKKS